MVKKLSNEGMAPMGQPIRFYKFVALTFLAVTIVLLAVIMFMSAKRADVTIITRSEPIETNMNITIDPTATDSLVHGFVTTTLVELEKSYAPQGTKDAESVAGGMVTLYNDTAVDQPLIEKTRLLSTDGILFRLKTRVVVPAKKTIQTEVYADQAGKLSEIAPSNFTIPGLNEEKQKVIYAKSTEAMQGGVRKVGIVSDADYQKAKEAMKGELEKNGSDTLAKLFPDKKSVFTVAQFSTDNSSSTLDAIIGKETDSFAVKGTATVVGVFYDNDEMKKYATSMLRKQVVDNSEVLQSEDSEPVVTLSSYDMEKGTAVLSTTHRGLVNIDPNSKELQKIMFFGKTEDEVRRYVMSLNHVQGVEMNFRPMWNRCVPHVADHVTITVRQVE